MTVTCLPGHLRQPLDGEARPLQGVSHDKVVQKWRILLPYLVLFVDNPLLSCLVKVCSVGRGGWGGGRSRDRAASGQTHPKGYPLTDFLHSAGGRHTGTSSLRRQATFTSSQRGPLFKRAASNLACGYRQLTNQITRTAKRCSN